MVRSLARRWLAVGGVVGLTALSLMGCGKQVPDPDPETPTTVETITVTPDSAVTKAAPPEPAGLGDVWPLTGLPGELVERPSVAVKIENSSAARPQVGLDGADVVFEEVVEGGIVRYVAIFHSELPEAIGPIRSIRPMDGPIAGPTHGLMVATGGQGRFLDIAREAGLQLLLNDYGDGGFFRQPGRGGDHNVFGHLTEFIDRADDGHKASPPGEFRFAVSEAEASAVVDGQATSRIEVTMSGDSHPNWDWDAETGRWLRWEGSREAIVEDGTRLSATNVITLSVEVTDAGGVDSAGSPIPLTIMVSQGPGLVASGGKSIEVTWSKESDVSPIVLVDAAGDPVLLAPGKTWVELVPTYGSFTPIG